MKAYMGYEAGEGPGECAILIFAHTVREARKILWREGGDYFDFLDYTHVAATLLKDSDWILKYADQEKLKNDEPHLIDDPPTCKDCERWGSEILEDGICTECRENEEENKRFESEHP